MTYGYTVTWTNIWGETQKAWCSNCETPERAREGAVRMAKKMGWPGNPKWWQFWRWGDTRLKEDLT